MEIPTKMDDLGVPLFLETPIFAYIIVWFHSLNFYREWWKNKKNLGFKSELFVVTKCAFHNLGKSAQPNKIQGNCSLYILALPVNIIQTYIYDSCNLPLSLCTCTSFLISYVLGANSPFRRMPDTKRPHIFCEGTHPETNSQENGWKWKMKLGWPIFRDELLVSGRVHPTLPYESSNPWLSFPTLHLALSSLPLRRKRVYEETFLKNTLESRSRPQATSQIYTYICVYMFMYQ